MVRSFFLISVIGALFVAGCAKTEYGTEANSSTPSESATVAGTEMAVCDGCGAEVAQDMLASHDGKMMCKDCIAMHSNSEGTVACTSCGSEMEMDLAVMKDGEPYCEACAGT